MPDHLESSRVCLVGAGPMAVEYARVLQARAAPFDVIGRSEKSAEAFRAQVDVPVYIGGLDCWLADRATMPLVAIVAVGVDELSAATAALLEAGTRRILVEKPGALDLAQLERLVDLADGSGAEVSIAYNRRFYASTLAAERMIADDGGATSFQFEFTEWSHRIAELKKPAAVLAAWFLANSSHVVDLAFFLGGRPVEMHCRTSGSLAWHPSASVFCGSGVSDRGALFSYQANWASPGRWGVEIMTRHRRLILRPMETLQVQKHGTIEVVPVALDDACDDRFKPGLYRQVQAFLTGDDADRLPTLHEHFHLASTALASIAGGTNLEQPSQHSSEPRGLSPRFAAAFGTSKRGD